MQTNASRAPAPVQAILGLIQSWRHRAPSAGARRMALRETIALDPRRRLHLIECDGRQVLLLTGGAQDFVVGWLPQP